MMTEDEQFAMFHRFNRRMKKLGIKIEYISNIPWIYIRRINDKPVTENFQANHGFCAFWYPVKNDQTVVFSDRRKVFELIRRLSK